MKRLINIIFTSIFALLAASANADEGYNLPVMLDGKDTIPYVYLRDVYVFPPLTFKNQKEEKFYWRTVRDVKKTLPYAKIAGKIMQETDRQLKDIPEKQRKEYLKQKEKELFSQFEGDLKKMTVSQGKMLIRLIDRECDKTSYELIKTYKGGFSAVFWQGFSRIFGLNLKAEYDGSDKDAVVERVIILVESGQL